MGVGKRHFTCDLSRVGSRQRTVANDDILYGQKINLGVVKMQRNRKEQTLKENVQVLKVLETM
jgi:hypothetical protein